MTGTEDETVIWHDVECGGYDTDLPLWRELAAAASGPVLELGCGTGRVALDLARRGHAVSAVDRDPALVEALRERARSRGVEIAATVGDLRELAAEDRFELILAPMQVAQLLDGADDRRAMFAAAARALAAGGVLAIAIVEGVPAGGGSLAPLPDVAEIDEVVYSSLPLEIIDRGERMLVTRLRQVVSPAGALTEAIDETLLAVVGAAEIEAEAGEAGLVPAGRREVPATDSHVGSSVLLFEAGGPR